MKNIFKIISLLIIVIVAFLGCTKSDIEKANEDYNYNNIEPYIYAITGPAATAASGLASVTYTATPRGGSTYTWSVEDHGATINVLNPSYKVEILWDQSDVDVTAKVVCIEKTQGGKVSEPAYYDVSLSKFKPMEFDEFLGDWSGTETDEGGNTYDLNLTLTAGADENTLIFAATDGTPALMSALFEGWGETFQPGFGNEGDIILIVDLLTGGVSIDCSVYVGQTEPGPWDYWFRGIGTWEGFNKTMSFDFFLQFDDQCQDDYNPSSITLAKQ